ncbi:hypothetical protein BDR05DRAFT_1006687 [Suillus weaverae]|nr:hypothetical protein BDR05DRAFT_1006687 [Suillus weaverae]
MEEKELIKIQSMLAMYGKIAQQTLVCADFISHYSETKSIWLRLGKYVFDETDTTIQSYNDVLNSLMQQFRHLVARDTVVIAHHMDESLDLVGMEYAMGARLNTSKCCLPNTRQHPSEGHSELDQQHRGRCSTCLMVVWHSGQG